MDRNKSIIEGILFAKGEPVAVEDIASVLELTADEAGKLTEELAAEYVAEGRGIRITRLEDSYQMCTDRSVYDALIKYVTVPRKYALTDVMLETLAIVAYRQPVTRVEIENIRGVSSDHAINRLIEYGLIEEAGRRKAPGRPQTFRTTDEFLRRFGLSSKEDLPGVDPETMEYIRQSVAAETGYYETEDEQLELDLDDPTKDEIRDETDKEAAELDIQPQGEVIDVEI